MTLTELLSWNPCYSRKKIDALLNGRTEWSVRDVLQEEALSASDRLWVVLREECFSSRTLRLFAVDCARRALDGVANPDLRVLKALDVAEAFAKGEATKEELAAAFNAASYAASAAASYTASYAASSASFVAPDASAASAYSVAYYAAAYAPASERQEQINYLMERA